MANLQGNVHDLREEVTNLDRQREATERVIQTLDRQLAAITTDVDETTTRMAAAERELAGAATHAAAPAGRHLQARPAVLRREALLTARSFGELVGAVQVPPRARGARPVARARASRLLRDQIGATATRISCGSADAVEENRADKQREEERLARAARRALDEPAAGAALGAGDPGPAGALARVGVAADERDRVDRGGAAPERGDAGRTRRAQASTLRTSDLGELDWPVDGTVLYRFGRVVNPNNTTTRWNGDRHRGADGHAGASRRAGHGGERRTARHVRPHRDRAARRRRLLGVRLAQRASVRSGSVIRKGDIDRRRGRVRSRPRAASALRDPTAGTRGGSGELAARRALTMSVTKRCPVCGRFRAYDADDDFCIGCGTRGARSRTATCGRVVRVRAGRGGGHPLPALRRAYCAAAPPEFGRLTA